VRGSFNNAYFSHERSGPYIVRSSMSIGGKTVQAVAEYQPDQRIIA
jgi:hypothetical protein